MTSPENFAGSMADVQRLLHNLIRVGSIHAVDLASTPARVRVLLSAEDETAGGQLVTDWRPYFERRAGTTSTWNPPTVGEQCAVISPGGDLAACLVLVGLHSTRNPAPSASASHHTTRYPDGAVIQYDHAAHALTATLPGGGTATLVAPGSVTIDSPDVTITGNCTVQKTLTYLGGMVGRGVAQGAQGAAQIEGDVRTTGDVVAGGISLQGHTHGGVQRGGDSTGAPQ